MTVPATPNTEAATEALTAASALAISWVAERVSLSSAGGAGCGRAVDWSDIGFVGTGFVSSRRAFPPIQTPGPPARFLAPAVCQLALTAANPAVPTGDLLGEAAVIAG